MHQEIRLFPLLGGCVTVISIAAHILSSVHYTLTSAINFLGKGIHLKHPWIFRARRQILLGRRRALALELTNKCPLSCPGCYAYQPGHVLGRPLEWIQDYQGDELLVAGVLALLEERRPLGLFLVGGEPLVRIRELRALLPEICRRGIEVEVVTSGIVRIPSEWMQLKGLNVVISIDGLQPEHDRRRVPATYERILENIEGRRVSIHCTITSQMAKESGSLQRFLDFWSNRTEVQGIRMSLYTPQIGEISAEILNPEERIRIISELDRLRKGYPKLRHSDDMIEAYLNPPEAPSSCVFARVTECVSADLETVVLPCQLGGEPDCRQCGCVAAVGMQAVSYHRLPGGLPVREVFRVSNRIGAIVRAGRRKLRRNGRGRGVTVLIPEDNT